MCSPSAPTPPDPNQVSAAQTRSNIETANYNAGLNRVNQNTPWGSLTYTRTPGAGGGFDQAGYDAAMQQWDQSHPRSPIYAGGGENGGGEIVGYSDRDMTGAPTRDQFMTTGGPDQWTANITLSPEQQRLLDNDSRIRASFGNMAEVGLDRVRAALGPQFDTSHLTGYRDVPAGGGASGYTGGGRYETGANSRFGIQSQLGDPSARFSEYSGDRQRVEDALYSRLNPQLQRDRNALVQRLANQGIVPGSEAYNTEIQLADQRANDARMQAILAGGQEQSRLFGMEQAAGQFANQAQAQDFGQRYQNATLNNQAQQQQFAEGLARQQQANAANQQNFAQQQAAAEAAQRQRQQQMQEEAFLRGLPLNELNALRTGAQITAPQFTSVPGTNVTPTDVSGNAYRSYQGQQQNYGQQVGANNNLLNGLFSLGTALL